MNKFRLAVFAVACIFTATQSGCAAVTALKMPGPVADEDVRRGMSRSQVETLIGGASPSSEYQQGDIRVAKYDYSDGPPGASKIRVLPYFAGDFFTLFLSEVIFWPIESHAKDRIKRVGTAHYDANGVLEEWQVSRTDGEVLISTFSVTETIVAPKKEVSESGAK